MKHINRFMKYRANAIKCVETFRSGEWKPYMIEDKCFAAIRRSDGKELWLANGAWCCDIRDECYFGYIWRHYVWWMAGRKFVRDAERQADIPEL